MILYGATCRNGGQSCFNSRVVLQSCNSEATMCGRVRQCEWQYAVVRAAVRTARGSVRQCVAVVIIIVIMQPPCFATKCCYNNTAAPVLRSNYYHNARICGWSTDGSCTDLRVVYGRVIYGSAGGLRIYGWGFRGLRVIHAARGHGVPIGQIIIQIIAAPGGVLAQQ
jgi:hypothetical protein